MANYYEQYQIPYDYYNQVNNNLYDHNQFQYQQQQFGYDPNPMSYNYYNWNGSESETSSVAYSVSTMSEPKHLFYDPNYYTTYESPPQFSIYCSVQGFNEQEFNEPEFDEYDPTPYSGGYDIVSTYGKPRPPTVETCYPSSNTTQAKSPSPPEIITPVPLGIYDGGEKKGEVKAVKKRVTFAEPLDEAKPTETIKEEEDDDDEEDEEDEEEEHGTDKSEALETGEVKEALGSGNDGNVEKVEVKALYVPSGYGLEATDLCEAIFGGYFPCMLRNKRLQKEEEDRAAYVSCWESNDSDLWKTTSDYLFGDSYPYGYENRVERNQFEISSYGYRRY